MRRMTVRRMKGESNGEETVRRAGGNVKGVAGAMPPCKIARGRQRSKQRSRVCGVRRFRRRLMRFQGRTSSFVLVPLSQGRECKAIYWNMKLETLREANANLIFWKD